MILRLSGIVILGALLGSWSAAAQNSDPSQEVIPPTTLGPSYDPSQIAPANPSAPAKPTPRTQGAVLMAPPTRAAPLSAPFDGIWVGNLSCEAYHEKPSFHYWLIMEIRDGSWSRLNASTIPGRPGYDHYEATTSADGHVTLTRTAVGDGRLPGGPMLGEAISSKFVGMFSGATFTAWGDSGRCSIQLVRQL